MMKYCAIKVYTSMHTYAFTHICKHKHTSAYCTAHRHRKVSATRLMKKARTGLLAPLADSSPPSAASHIDASSYPSAQHPIQLPANDLGKWRNLAQGLGPCTFVGDLDKAPGSWFWE